jgi:putative ABC transport system permease protein
MVHYLKLAIKNSKHRGLRSWLTLLGIFIGIVTVISLITVGNGLKTAVNAQFGVESTQTITVQAGGLNYGAPGSGAVTPLTKDDAKAIERLSTVDVAIPRNIKLTQIEYNDQIEFSYATTIVEGYEQDIYEIGDLEAEKGRMLKTGDLGKVVLGYNFADGDKNGFDKDIGLGKSILIQGKSFRVIGIAKKKGSFILDNVVLIYDQDLNDLLNYGNEADLIGVRIKDPDLMDKTQEDIEKLLRNRRDVKEGEEDFEVSTPEAALGQVNSILTAIQIFIVLIASIAIFVGAIGIINTMATSVVERKKEIGIMKAIGAKNYHIFMQFFVESGLMGFIGGVLGVIFGLAIGYFGTQAINNFVGATTPVEINIPLIVATLIGSFAIGSISGVYPAMIAAKQNPVEALRG